MKHQLTCIVCPMGCSIEVEEEDGKVLSVSGNTCKRGAEYAENEVTNPVRVVTTTVKTASGEVVPVKTDRAVPKRLIFDCMTVINSLRPEGSGLDIGTVVCADILNTGANVIVTAPAR